MSGLKELLNDEQGFKSDAKEKLDKKAFEKLADMKDRGIITEAEFNNKKVILLDKIQ